MDWTAGGIKAYVSPSSVRISVKENIYKHETRRYYCNFQKITELIYALKQYKSLTVTLQLNITKYFFP